MWIALFHHFWHKSTDRVSRSNDLGSAPRSSASAPGDKSFFDSLLSSHGEHKLIFDLRHYLNLSGFDLMEYKVLTRDGFEIILHRILVRNETDEHRAKRYPVLMVHGLMQSAAAYCTSGDDSLALCLARDGYDVWLGNNRGGFNPKHAIYSIWNPKMWKWGIKEMGTMDVPCMIDFILNKRSSTSNSNPNRNFESNNHAALHNPNVNHASETNSALNANTIQETLSNSNIGRSAPSLILDNNSTPALPIGSRSVPVSRTSSPRLDAGKIALVAHSQGTTQVFYALAKDLMPELADKISCFCALSPAVFAGPLLDRWFLKMIRPMNISMYRFFFGHHAFIGAMSAFHSIMPERWYTYFGYIMFNYLLGWDDTLWNGVYRSRQFLFSPVYVSADLMYWWLGKNGFASQGCIFDQSSPRWFDSDTLPPLQLFVPGRDNLVNPFRLVNRLETYENPRRLEIVDLPNYSHLDVLWAADASTSVADPMSKFIWSCVEDKQQWNCPGHSQWPAPLVPLHSPYL
ncbi:Yeh2p [Sugiyamaella lignohabitans]|uniref:Yeh2p n=1 Tax=Sugiyamaella lignohabitans TaxID=796027 RepID=A0A167DP81_9ASCO|nr:Yeh2p [Sugiyamaella lignohabitans]ANB13129.1 Yeh2p [Sugiyamaella lignohabitans]